MRFKLLLGLALVAVPMALVPAASSNVQSANPIRALLVIGGGYHDYAAQKEILTKGIPARANIALTVAYEPTKNAQAASKILNPVYEKADWWKDFDVIIHDECTADVVDLVAINRILDPHREGLPGVVLHCGMHSYRSEGWPKKTTPWFDFTGLATTGHGAQTPIDVSFVDNDNPITKGMENWKTIKEELYNNYTGKLMDTAKPLARGKQGKSDTVVVWTNIYNNKARVFCTTLGHNNETVADPRYLDLVTRGLLWSTNHLADDGKPAPGYQAKK